MPQIFYPTNRTRREFLQTSAAAVGAILTAQRLSSDESPATDRWALLSDTHIPANTEEAYRGFRPYENLQRIVPDVVARRPTGAVIAGDVARLEGLAGDYERVRELLAPLGEIGPTIMALGNHDDRSNFRAAFPAAPTGATRARVPDKHVVVIDQQPVRMIVLDSLMYVNKVAGFLGKAQRDWLADYLKNADDTPTVLFVHHTLGDGDGDLLDVPRLFDLVTPMPQVKAVFFGHSHVYSYQQREGLHLINLPAVGYSFSDDQPVGWVEAEWSRSGARLTLHAIASNTTADGEVREVEWR